MTKYNRQQARAAYVETTELNTKRGIVESPLDNIKQEERIRIIVDEIVSGKSKKAIILEYSDKWQCKTSTIKAILNEAVAFLHSMHDGNTPEELRAEQVSKLEELYINSSTADKLKIIDLVSKTLGLYDTSLTVKTDNNIKINLGV